MNCLFFATLSGLHVGLIFGLAGLAFVALFGALGMYFHHRRQELWHETARIALEKGQPLPALPDDPGPNAGDRKDSEDSDFRSGLILLAVGASLYVFLGALVGPSLAYVGLVPGFIGVALLIFALIRTLAARKQSGDADRPPHA
ncbi:MAG TPA: DUF6249 domain-containing protein [Opitutus sp.]|nr:DUF6249 domain-containing protein [Opitutus sp.]